MFTFSHPHSLNRLFHLSFTSLLSPWPVSSLYCLTSLSSSLDFFHLPYFTHSLTRLLTFCSLACTFSCFLPHWITFQSLFGFLSPYSLTCSIVCYLPPSLTHSLAPSCACCLSSSLVPSLTRSRAHVLACFLPSSSLVYALSCTLASSFPPCFIHSPLCSFALFLTHSLTYFLSFSLIHLLASLLHFLFTHYLACVFSLTRSLPSLPPSLTHSLARSWTHSLACFLLS